MHPEPLQLLLQHLLLFLQQLVLLRLLLVTRWLASKCMLVRAGVWQQRPHRTTTLIKSEYGNRLF